MTCSLVRAATVPVVSSQSVQVPAAFNDGDVARLRGLKQMRLLALSLLLLAAAVYVATRDRSGFLDYVNAGAEAAMVGAIADWFAVTALFRHPLGLPIPHTAIIPTRKQALGESLQEFVADNFLNEQVVRERIVSAKVSRRFGSWLSEDRHSRRVVDEVSRSFADGLAYVKDEDVAAVVRESLIPRLLEERLSPVVGQLLAGVLEDQAHTGFVDLALVELRRWLIENADEVTTLVGERAPWWTPEWVDGKVSTRLHREIVAWVSDIYDDPHHPARIALDRLLGQLAHDLEHDEATRDRAERLKQRLLAQSQVATTSIALWNALRRALISSLNDSGGLLRRRATEELVAFGQRLATDDALGARLDALLSDSAAYVVNNYGREVATVISETVNRWDGQETAERIELHVGRDLQFIRINGTVVGGLAGVAIYAISTVL